MYRVESRGGMSRPITEPVQCNYHTQKVKGVKLSKKVLFCVTKSFRDDLRDDKIKEDQLILPAWTYCMYIKLTLAIGACT